MRHTGRELELMMSGKKAMAAFCHIAADNINPKGGQNFDYAVKAGLIKFAKFVVRNPDHQRVIYTVYYMPGEEWRFKLYKVLKNSVAEGWNIDKEVIESILLDYDHKSICEYLRLLEKRL